jgi:hypothetical protein
VRRKKVTYPPPKTATKGGAATPAIDRNVGRAVSIDLTAMIGRAEIRQGDKVRIMSGLYAGETAIVESLVGGVIPAALVRTEAGRTRRTRTIDLAPYRPGADAQPETGSNGT